MAAFKLPRRMIEETFSIFRSCGDNQRECQLYWTSPWSAPQTLTEVVHPKHYSGRYGLSIDSGWISRFWNELSNRGLGVRIQVHTHPEEAFHSATDDSFPLLFDPGFLSLVIPDFAMGPVGFRDAYLTEIQPDGTWKRVDILGFRSGRSLPRFAVRHSPHIATPSRGLPPPCRSCRTTPATVWRAVPTIEFEGKIYGARFDCSSGWCEVRSIDP